MRLFGQERSGSTIGQRVKQMLKIAALSFACTLAPHPPVQAEPTEPHPESQGLSGHYGYVLMDADTGKILAERNADQQFTPASLAKIPTMLIALDTLGPTHRFETRLLAEGRIDAGTLHGNLHLVGSGDPALKTRDLASMADALARQGIARIAGDFTFNTDALPHSAVIEKTQPAHHGYNPAISGLNVDLNVWRSNGVRRKVPNPGLHAARLFHNAASRRGIILPPPKHLIGKALGRPIVRHRSAPVSQIVEGMMEHSTNLTAEALGALSIGAMGTPPTSLADAAHVTADWIKNQPGSIGGKGWEGFSLANHSGLTSQSRATPRQIASILHLGKQRFGEMFRALYPEHATSGFQAFEMRGKIGLLRFVRGYAGFLSIGGRDLIFAIMANDIKQRAQADAGVRGLQSEAWMAQALKLELAILGDWIAEYWPTARDTSARAERSTQPILVAPIPTPKPTR